MEETDNGITIDCEPSNRKNQWTVAVRCGCRILAIDTFNITKASERTRFTEDFCSEHQGIPPGEVEAGLRQVAGDALARVNAPKEPDDDANPLDSMPEEVKADARLMLTSPDLIEHIVDDIATLGVAGERTLAATVYLVGTSRLLRRPLAAIIQGLTSSGKSYVAAQVAKLFPPEAVIHAHTMTLQALFHMPEGSLMHRFIVAGERSRQQNDKTADANKALREMISDGRLDKMMPVKDKDKGITTQRIQQQGPIAYIESTTLQNILDEDRNRCIILNTDERQEQTKRIIERIAKDAESALGAYPRDDVIQKHHAAQRMLCQVAVAIPFARQLAKLFPTKRTDARRAFGHIGSIIETVALLHQYQRVAEPTEGGIITAIREDYEFAHYLLAEPMGRMLGGGASNAMMRFFERLQNDVQAPFTTSDVMQVESTIGDIQTVRGYCRSLAELGYLVVDEPARGSKPARYSLAPNLPDHREVCGLPDPEVLFAEVLSECPAS